jgi:hypothetical protein
MAAIDMHMTIEELLRAVVSVRSVPRLYNEGQLPLDQSLESFDGCEKSGRLV